MSDGTLGKRLQEIEGEGPSADYLDQLRRRLAEHPDGAKVWSERSMGQPSTPTVVSLGQHGDPPQRRARSAWFLSAAAALLGIVYLAVAYSGRSGLEETEAASEVQQVGDAWLRAIVENDADGFAMLHAADMTVNDTLMGYSRDVDTLTPARIAELYMAGFVAFQESVAADGDVIRLAGCQSEAERVRCGFTVSLIGTDQYTYTIVADLIVEERQIITIDFAEVVTEPADLRRGIDRFLSQFAVDEDRSCLLLGFNTPGCGQHDSDFMRRYIEFYEMQ